MNPPFFHPPWRRCAAAAGTALLLQFGAGALAQPPAPSDGPAQSAIAQVPELDFLRLASRFNQQQLALARLALDHSRDVRVRQFAQEVVDDHTAMARQLQGISAGMGILLPATEPPAGLSRLQRLRGTAFDRQFVAEAACAQGVAVASHRQQARTGHQTSVVRFASDALPSLRKHLARTQALATQLGVPKGGSPDARCGV